MDKLNRNDKIDALARLKQTTEEARRLDLKKDGSPDWEVYRSDASEYFLSDEWREKVVAFFERIHKMGEKVTYLDVGGTANGAALGADKNYAFSLKTPKNLKKSRNRIFLEGDVFSTKDFQGLLSQFEGENRPSLITFEPYGGIQQYLQPRVEKVGGNTRPAELKKVQAAYYRLGTNLARAIDVLRPGGFILIGDFGVDAAYHTKMIEGIPDWVRELAAKKNCAVEFGEFDRILIQKNEASA